MSDAELRQALEFYKFIGCRSLGDYRDMYLRSDVLILAYVFKNFPRVCGKVYQLDPAHFFPAQKRS